MKTGMLWFDNDPHTDLSVKISRAADYYQKKYGCKPNLCYVHPSMVQPQLVKTAGVEIRPNQMVLPNHLWLGILSV